MVDDRGQEEVECVSIPVPSSSHQLRVRHRPSPSSCDHRSGPAITVLAGTTSRWFKEWHERARTSPDPRPEVIRAWCRRSRGGRYGSSGSHERHGPAQRNHGWRTISQTSCSGRSGRRSRSAASSRSHRRGSKS
jgi:hypothetical protein